MSESGSVTVTFGIPEGEPAPDLSDLVGVSAEEKAPATPPDAFLPLAVLLAVVIPPGLALLAQVVSRVVHSWKDHGVLIDATGDAPVVKPMPGTPYGTIVIIGKDGQQTSRSDLPEEDLSKYIAAAVGALSGGASAQAAQSSADAAVAANGPANDNAH